MRLLKTLTAVLVLVAVVACGGLTEPRYDYVGVYRAVPTATLLEGHLILRADSTFELQTVSEVRNRIEGGKWSESDVPHQIYLSMQTEVSNVTYLVTAKGDTLTRDNDRFVRER